MRKKFYTEEELVFVEKPTHGGFEDLEGQNFGRLTVIEFSGNRKWFCKCKCGNIVKINSCSLKRGLTKSCGCLKVEVVKEIMTLHGHTRDYKTTPTYATWANMLARCLNPNVLAYPDYGGRGIKVCERWLRFENFLADMGERQKGMTIERVENNKGYYKENCRWASRREQNNNKRSNHLLTFNGRTQNVTQ